MYKDVKPSWEKSKFPRGNFFIINKNPWLFDPWLFLFLWHCLYCIMDSLSLCRHQNLINFKFLQKQVFMFVTVLIMNKYWAFFSFYGIKIWLRAGKDIFAIFQSVVRCAFACRFLFPYVIVAYMKYPFSDIFFTQAFETLFFFLLLMNQGILTFNSSWNILVLLGCMQVLATSAASHYSFLCLPIAFPIVLRLEGKREKWCKKLLVKSDTCIIHGETFLQ